MESLIQQHFKNGDTMEIFGDVVFTLEFLDGKGVKIAGDSNTEQPHEDQGNRSIDSGLESTPDLVTADPNKVK